MHRSTCFALLLILFGFSLYAQGPTLTLVNNGVVTPGIDPWNGELCLFQGNPSQAASSQGICFQATDDLTAPENLFVSATSSNPLVIPINSNNLKVTYDVNPGGMVGLAKIFLSPLGVGETTIIVTVKDEDWNTSSYFITVLVKSCKDLILIGAGEIDPLAHGTAQSFFANDVIQTRVANFPIIRGNDNIELFAGNCVLLSNGFEVRSGGEFLADIGDCN